jgi:hypothetical protein
MGRRFSSRYAFIEGHGDALHFTDTALEDYLLARFGISNLLLSGFELGTQAVEKLLKAFLLFSDPTFGKKEKNVLRAIRARARELGRTEQLAHDVVAALDLAEKSGFSSSPGIKDRMERINAYYLKRYPSGGALGGLRSLSTADVHDLDEAVFEIWDAFKNLNAEYYYTSGILRDVYGMALNGPLPWWDHRLEILAAKNLAFARRKDDITRGIEELIRIHYPELRN